MTIITKELVKNRLDSKIDVQKLLYIKVFATMVDHIMS